MSEVPLEVPRCRRVFLSKVPLYDPRIRTRASREISLVFEKHQNARNVAKRLPGLITSDGRARTCYGPLFFSVKR